MLALFCVILRKNTKYIVFKDLDNKKNANIIQVLIVYQQKLLYLQIIT